jgi:sulfur-oxidizing protein SoxY
VPTYWKDGNAFTVARKERRFEVNENEEAETSISISTNPNFRFTYENTNDSALDVTSVDTDETTFVGRSQQLAAAQ